MKGLILVFLLAVSLGAAGMAFGSDLVPLKGSGSFAPAADATLVPCGLGIYVPSTFSGSGELSHLGSVTTRIYVDTCSLGPGGLSASGTADQTAANGDVLHLGHYTLIADPVSGAFRFTDIALDGGTGRFAHAVGSSVGTGVFDFATGNGDYSVQGTISSVGSGR